MSDLAQKIKGRARQMLGPDVLAEAVTAVLDGHSFEPFNFEPGGYCQEDGQFWPCRTVRAVASALGVREDGED